jgi:DNA-binding PadR family transcriptional regulator
VTNKRKTGPAPATQRSLKGEAGAAVDGARSRLPTIGYVILGRLAQADETGYDLSLFMGPPRNYIWEASHSQIYPLLASLTELGYVEFTEVAQSGRPNKKVYSITDTGRRALEAWVADAPTPMTRRLEFNAKVNSLWLLPVAEAIEVLQQQIGMTEAEIEMIEGHMSDAEQRSGSKFPPAPASKYSGIYANIKYAIESRRYMIEWYRWIRSDFEAARAPALKPSARARAKKS